MAARKKRTALFTGTTGFIGRRLVRKVLAEQPDLNMVFLVQKKFEATALKDIEAWEKLPEAGKRTFSVVCGDITDGRLGLGDQYQALCKQITEVWHLAAIYDLAVGYEFSRRVNVDGTRNIVAFCQACPKLDRLVYYSTCYVAGDRLGTVKEDELLEGQGFKNYYESTKHAAEVVVAQAMANGLPAVVIRPSIVVGDSTSGETDKFDGPYFGMEFVHKLRWVPMSLPRPGACSAEMNIVPVDYLVDATVVLAYKKEALGGTFQVSDPKPLPARELYSMICESISGRPSKRTIPPQLLEAVLRVGPLQRWLGVPVETLSYFNHPVRYDTQKTLSMLQGSGVSCPSMRNYLAQLISFWRSRRGAAGFHAKA